MTQAEILQEFKQLSIRQQLEMLRAALEIIESNYEASTKKAAKNLPVAESGSFDDPLLALAGKFESPLSDIGHHHDQYIGSSLKDDHNE